MDNWDEVRTAYQVARMGTVSGAAEVLGVHHATVIRHIDAIEARLGVKLFQRHARGYTPTEAGQDLFQVAQATDDQFNQLVGRLKGQGDDVSGELVVTSLASVAPLIAPVLADFQELHPDLIVRYLTGDRVFRLEYGEAHVAIRAGRSPDQLDNVVQPFLDQSMTLCASRTYIDEHGMPETLEDLRQHRFIGNDDMDSRAPYSRWLSELIDLDKIKFRCTNTPGRRSAIAMREAVLAGAGIGFFTPWEAQRHPELVEVMGPRPEWTGKLWLVTHVDLHRTTKVQSFLTFLKDRAKEWTF